MTTQQIHVWLDAETGPAEGREAEWIVSLADGDRDDTLAVYETREEAESWAREEAERRGLGMEVLSS